MKTQKIEFRCSSFEKKLYKKKAQRAGISLSEYCRQSINEQTIKARLTTEEIEIFKLLIGCHNKLKSTSNLLKNKDTNFNKMLIDTCSEIKQHLSKFK